eukprot:TRINITY_DN10080_c0_g1_i5.p4 TRINITY_DN10080_c0_g1~~TRINITY_DN10080_c0_g1_i5.p4  ORF type:complete len:106 (-),score=23.48 TRINITY_DN10080_c0_g1_i5:734-1051(-)
MKLVGGYYSYDTVRNMRQVLFGFYLRGEVVDCVRCFFFFFFQAEDGIRDVERSRGLGDVYKRQVSTQSTWDIILTQDAIRTSSIVRAVRSRIYGAGLFHLSRFPA